MPLHFLQYAVRKVLVAASAFFIIFIYTYIIPIFKKINNNDYEPSWFLNEIVSGTLW